MFGLGVGKMEMKIPKVDYSSGEEIAGTLFLTIKKPAKARGVFVRLYAEQEKSERDSKGNQTRKTETLYEFQLQLDEEKEYGVTGEPFQYPFRITVPEFAHMYMAGSDPFGVNIGPVRIGLPLSRYPPRWFLRGYLDLPLAFDVSARTQINIVR